MKRRIETDGAMSGSLTFDGGGRIVDGGRIERARASEQEAAPPPRRALARSIETSNSHARPRAPLAMLQLGAPRVACARPRRERRVLTVSSSAHGAYTVLGTSRKQNEDRWAATPSLRLTDGSSVAYYGVFDGHGGNATSQWLTEKLSPLIAASFSTSRSKESIEAIFEAADEQLLAPQGFMGMGARGIGASARFLPPLSAHAPSPQVGPSVAAPAWWLSSTAALCW